MHVGHDLRVVGRGLLRAPGLTLLVVLTLGLAIGANSATFSLIDRVALRPLPVEKPEQLVMRGGRWLHGVGVVALALTVLALASFRTTTTPSSSCPGPSPAACQRD